MAKTSKKPAKVVLAAPGFKEQPRGASMPNGMVTAQLAHHFWEEGGRRNGEADANWIRAEDHAGIPFS